MSRRETKRREDELRRKQTDYMRSLRNDVLEQSAIEYRRRGDLTAALHNELMLLQWRLIDDAHTYIEGEHRTLFRGYRRRTWMSGLIFAAAGLLVFPRLFAWLFG